MQKQKTGKLIIISGPSGVGKGAIISNLFKNEKLNIAYSVSYTTRKPRNNEINGINYFFIDERKFLAMIKNNEFIEFTNFINNYYGTSKEYVNNLLKQGKNVILEIEVDGANKVLKLYQNKKNIISIFIMPPSYQKLEERIRYRGSEAEDIIEKRLSKAKEEFKVQHEYDYIVVNDILEVAIAEISAIISQNSNY